MNHFDKLSELSAQLSQLYAQWAKQYNLTLNELRFLYYIGRNGQCSATEIGDKWSLPKQTVTSVCKQLNRKEFLLFVTDEKDKRSKFIRLSVQGEQFTQPLIDTLTKAELQVSKKFGDKKLEKLLKEFDHLQQIFTQQLYGSNADR
ncbi:DNA-binding MarR family transcriptional regulator [Cricetibacter osteomyelitidis]|uniref:DNA-binding MarR family transcriptional regulator n=1 Tax=Cricetibacter osteomyelitidis TaxID=1521931 RepID=A0A4R2T058_9PAST|nr:MarR family transcriptional regulator [Cricetibacter osteomyelitidis]TCP96217.1 DNA-binding MarR family transcriptional regulator [Cricetibacter osteomyelitidis]